MSEQKDPRYLPPIPKRDRVPRIHGPMEKAPRSRLRRENVNEGRG
jgi:hypothetical protein